MFNLAGQILILVLAAIVSASPKAAPADSNTKAPAPSGVFIRVDEGASRVYVSQKPAEVELAVVSDATRETRARIAIEVVDPRDIVRAWTEMPVTLAPGRNVVNADLDLTSYTDTALHCEGLLDARLRYRILPAEGSSSPAPLVSDQIALVRIAPDLFSVQVVAPALYGMAERYVAYVNTYYPATSKPKSGADISGVFEIEDDSDDSVSGETQKPPDRRLTAHGRTDSSGRGTLEFTIPTSWIGRQAYLTVLASDGEIKFDVEESIDSGVGAWTVISTDKPLYQPGQKMRLRMLVLQNTTRKPYANTKLELKILDPEETVLHAVNLKTSRFGVASTDWDIPETSRLGEYTIEANLPELDPEEDWDGWKSIQRVRITRYDLPNFTVESTPDQKFYLPGEDAKLNVEARYLFGKPVPKSKVRVVQETDREWNYDEQRWDIEEGQAFEAETDERGQCSISIDLKEADKRLSERDYADYDDETYSVYVTDRSTGKTEQRRVDLRLSKEPLHLRVVDSDYGRQSAGLPWEFYVTAFFPDGTPASCPVTVEVFGKEDPGEDEQPIAHVEVRTNRFGLAKVPGLIVNSSSKWFDVRLSATMPSGHRVRMDRRLWTSDGPSIRIRTATNIQRSGEPLHVEIESDLPDTDLTLSVWAGSALIHTAETRLVSGHAEVTFPYLPTMRRDVLITAFSFQHAEEPGGAKVVLYPGEPDTRLDVRTGRSQYRPGDQARAEFQVQQRDGIPTTEFILGVVAIDRAVEERARTIREFEMRGVYFDGLRIPDYDYREYNGITLDSLLTLRPEQIDTDYDLVAGLVASPNAVLRNIGETAMTYPATLYSGYFKKQFDPIAKELDATFTKLRSYPRDEAALQAQMRSAGIPLRELRDPWGNSYRFEFWAAGSEEGFKAWTSGPDEKAATDDDFQVFERRWPYFLKYGEILNRAHKTYHERTGRFIRDAHTLKAELRRHGVDFDKLRDPWGEPFKLEFEIVGRCFTTTVNRGRTAEPARPLWRLWINYWEDTETKIRLALADDRVQKNRYPPTAEELLKALKAAGIRDSELADPWGNPANPVFVTEWRYTDKVVTRSVASFGGQPRLREDIVPTNQELGHWRFMSRGPDGIEGTMDDFMLGRITGVLSEKDAETKPGKSQAPPSQATPSQPDTAAPPKAAKLGPVLVSGSTGAISGTVIDSSGAAIPGVELTAVDELTGRLVLATTTDEGTYAFSDLAPGHYTVQAKMEGFRTAQVDGVPVQPNTITRLDFKLEVGALAENVMVEAESVQMSTASAEISEVVRQRVAGLPAASALPFTPRVRQYFPETLFWYPELEVGKDGRAELSFQLPDNLTTWKTSVIATSLNGDVAYKELEFETFQPFFLEPDPPQFLTAGDRIDLPVVIRNYLDSAQEVALEIEPGDGLEVEGARQTKARAPAQESVPVYFPLRAVKPTPKAQPKVTGIAGETGDAVVKDVEIRPDGREESLAEGRLFGDASAWTFRIPATAMAGTPRGELRIYTDVGAHIIDAIAGVQANPNGCPEQIISSTFPSILLLQYDRAGGRVEAGLRQRALRDVELSCMKLSSFSRPGGGFSYWRETAPNLALTAYALRFLTAARDFTLIDEELVKQTAQALLARQEENGRWPAYWHWGDRTEDARQSVSLTAYIARSLAELKDAQDVFSPVVSPGRQEARTLHSCLERAFAYLEPLWDRTSDPYVVALYAQAALRCGKNKEAEQAVRRLLELAKREGPTTYWNLETNSVFWGWGREGRIETTALAVQALTLARTQALPAGVDPEEINRPLDAGAQFLLKHKDCHGIWLTGQATVLTLEALVGVMPPRPAGEEPSGQLAVKLNGRVVDAYQAAGDKANGGPGRYDLSRALRVGSNKLEVSWPKGAPGLALLSSSWYEPWSAPRTRESEVNSNTRLGFNVSFDRRTATRGESVECRVKVERIGFRGYGMLLAEIGLPPGVDVDRASLEAARDQAGWALASYEVLPDRIVMYLWPRAGGIEFAFKFKPRLGMVAKSTASTLYDYYNPDLRAVLVPQVFEVRGK